LDPVVPDRPALGAPPQYDAQCGYANDHTQSPRHDAPSNRRFPVPTIGRQLGHFQAATAAVLQNSGNKGVGSMSSTEQQWAGEFDVEYARRVLKDVFAPWVQELGLSVEAVDYIPPVQAADWQPGAILRMPFSERLCRHGGVICGQALMAFADTAMVIAMVAANRGYRPMTTVDQTTHFMRAIASSDVRADARVVRLGRNMSFGRVTLSSTSDNKPVAMVSSAFAML
jgi:uncharacterized protein (TIGR00369 family)